MKQEALTEEELEQLPRLLPGWALEGRELEKAFAFPSYLAGIEFVRKLAVAAEEMNHHPDLRVGWRKVTVRLSTHSAGAVTALDVELARKAEALAGRG
jgi:4a-hydroxytetrahydrobiopterin dehydratase